jgi:hypothetical protein
VQNEQLNVVAEELKMISRVEKEASARTAATDSAATAAASAAQDEPARR